MDFNYHVNNLVYMNLALANIDAEYLKEHTLESYYVAYYKESFLDDEWECQIYNQGDDYCHQFFRKSDGELLCAIKSSWTKKIASKRDIREANFNIANLQRQELCLV